MSTFATNDNFLGVCLMFFVVSMCCGFLMMGRFR